MEFNRSALTRSGQRRRVFVVFCASATVISLSGCAYFKTLIGLGPTRPKVRVTDVAVTGASLLGIELAVGLRVDNPNDFDLKFSMLRYQFSVSDTVVAKGSYDPKIVVPANGGGDVRLPLTIDAGAALNLIQSVTHGKHDLEGLVTALAKFETPLGDMDVDFQDKRPLGKIP